MTMARSLRLATRRTAPAMSRHYADGYYTVGRADDVFSVRLPDQSVELESAVIEHPAVAEAAVVPAPDPVRLAVPAYITLTANSTPDRATALDLPPAETLAPFADQAPGVFRAAEDDLGEDPSRLRQAEEARAKQGQAA